MSTKRYGVIDIGTTKIKAEIAEVQKGEVTRIFNSNMLTCFGVGIDENNGEPLDEYLQKTIQELKNLKNTFDKHGVTDSSVVSTHVMRKLKNPQKIKDLIEKETTFVVKTISDIEEAQFFFNAVLHSFTKPDQMYVVIDVGGGSVQISYGTKNNMINSYSIPTGTISLQERFLPKLTDWNDLKTSKEDIINSRKYIESFLKKLDLPKNVPLVYGSSMIIDVVKTLKLKTRKHPHSTDHPISVDAHELEKMIEHIGQFTFIERDSVFTDLPNRFTWGIDVGFINTITIAEHIQAPYIIPSNSNIAQGLILSMSS